MEGKPLPNSSRIIPLALPKGTEKLCELCQGRASLQCGQCRVTFYCDASHQLLDWVGIHERICPLLVPVRTETLQSLTKRGRIELDIKKKELIVVARSVAEGKLAEGKHEEALPAGRSCLRFCIDVFGSSTVELVPAYLLLAEANLGLGKLAPAAEMLSQAEWAVCKSPDCGHELKHRLHRALGRLQSAKGNLEDALFNFSNDIYHAAEAYGADSTVCRYGYFLIADVFAKTGKTAIARSMYKEVAQTWHSHLTELMRPFLQNPEESPLPTLDGAQQVAVESMLQTMLELEQRSLKEPGLTALLLHALAMTRLMEGDRAQALGFGRSALQSSHMSPNQELSVSVQRLLELLERPHL